MKKIMAALILVSFSLLARAGIDQTQIPDPLNGVQLENGQNMQEICAQEAYQALQILTGDSVEITINYDALSPFSKQHLMYMNRNEKIISVATYQHYFGIFANWKRYAGFYNIDNGNCTVRDLIKY